MDVRKLTDDVFVAPQIEVCDIPALAEPWFLMLDAECEFRIAMTRADLQKAGLDKLGDKWI